MTSKMLGTLRPEICRFKFGDFEITTFLDGANHRDGPHPFFGSDQTPEAVQALATANHLPPTMFENGYVPALVDTGSELVLFDTGNGPARRDTGVGNLRPLMGEAGYQPGDVDIVVITHGHPDHIGGLVEDGGPAFPNARYVFGRAEFDFWEKGEGVPEQRKANREMFVKLCVPLANQSTFIEPGQDVVSGITAVEAYGHSAGLLAYHIESAGQRLLLWADVCNHYVVSLQRPEWKVGVDDDKDRAVVTRRRILDMVATDGLCVLGHHMPFPAVGWVESVGGSYRWVPMSYQFFI